MTVRARFGWVSAAAIIATIAISTGCRTTAPSTGAPFTQTDLVVGTGATAATGQTLVVSYTGFMYDPNKANGEGPVFDSRSADNPFTFPLTLSTVINGWLQGIPGMKVGGTRKLVIPPDLAYGLSGVPGSIPPNATLVFEVTLISIQASSAGQ